MFEESLFESSVSLDQRQSARRTRWIALTSVVLQCLVVGAFLAVPILWPGAVPLVSVAPKLAMVAFDKPVPKVQPKPIPVPTNTNPTAVTAPSTPAEAHTGRGVLTHSSSTAFAAEGVSLYHGGNMAGTPSLDTLGIGTDKGPGIAVIPATPKSTAPMPISGGVMKGRLINEIHPIYPRIAIATRTEGTVVITATIDKQGRIQNLQVQSGPEMLRTAAVDAVKDARYKPFLLSGDPIDVVTTISVNFRLGS